MAKRIQNYTNDYDKFMEKHIVQKNNSNKTYMFTHTSLNDPKASYLINNEDYGKFMDLYCKVITKTNKNVYLTEKHIQYGPIVIDIDIKYTLTTKSLKHKYSRDDIITVIKLYNKYINKYLNLSDDKFDCYVIEKSYPTDISIDTEIKYKDGFHLIYPEICTKPDLQYIIRHDVIKDIINNKLLSEILQDNNIYDVFDEAVIERNNWLLYGSCKPTYENNKYVLTALYNKLLEDGINDLDNEFISELPKKLSIRQYNNFDDLSEFQTGYSIEHIEILYKNIIKPIKNTTTLQDTKIARTLLNMLNCDRSDNYQQWIELGWCLHNIDITLLDDWIQFSKKSSKYKENECEKLWCNMKDTGYTIRSLYRWANIDNPTEYFNFIIEENKVKLNLSLSGNSYDVAHAFFQIYKNDFACTSERHKDWYEFKNHRWQKCEVGKLIQKLNEDMVHKYLHMNSIFSKNAMNSEGDDKDKFIFQSTQCIKIANKLRNMPFKKQIIDELIGLYGTEYSKFTELADENKDLICFENGVYDLKKNIFRDGKPEDYITLCTKINYIPYDANNINILLAEKFIKDIQPDDDMNNYILDLMASCLQGHTPDEKFHIWSGSGSNGKSLSLSLLMSALGDYACTLPITMLTNKRPVSTAANPELAKTKGKRLCVFQEPENTDMIYVGHMKELTGGDKITTRGLYKDPIEFVPQFKLILTCNNLPEISANDGGTWRRLRVVEFKMKFVDNPTETEPLHKKKNPKIKEELFNLREAFMSILLHRFGNYKISGLIEPETVNLFTKNYQRNCDKFLEFSNRYIQPIPIAEISGDSGGSTSNFISTNTIWSAWKLWYKDFYSDKNYGSMKDLENNLLLHFKDNYNKIKLSNHIMTYFDND